MSGTTAAKQARMDAYARLRDSGMRPVDAGREIGVCDETRVVYERWYRRLRGLPVPRGIYRDR